MTRAPAVLRFSDPRRHGVHEVTDAYGVVARIAVGRTGNRFTVTDAQGALLCAGRTSRWRLPRRWDVTGPDGSPLLTARVRGIARTSVEVHLRRGGRLLVRGRAWRRDLRVTDEHGEVVLTAVPRAPAWSLRRHGHAVQQAPGRLELAEVVALVHIWGRTREEESATAAVGALAGGSAPG
ncbi:hypothetical protein SAMN05660464_0892 [Geodermatophilus dictyosporus]|uniref:Uncharacterized protein n=1 Tax=Geodermatophilus dictyosporus TaxID=1523247 RepID=A0A1I5JN67_9ACTN|nr:hypothetical protein [Geodermatophilus dictyosporus]SFO74227.1 hypothetical protein SAMN05660464_0892 [Geodermatophilus dictyosporus]